MTSIKKGIEISAVVPVYNSEEIVLELTNRIHEVLNKICSTNYEIILVDDCSTDNVWSRIKEVAAHPNVMGYRLGKNSGQWSATLAGINQASGKLIVTIDDDLEYEPADIMKLYNAITASDRDWHLVIGMAPDKYKKKNLDALTAAPRKKLVDLMWQKFPTDSFKIFRRELLFNSDSYSPMIHFEAFIKHSLDKRFAGYVEVNFNKRYAGKSNHPVWKKAYLFLKYSVEYYRTPVLGVAVLAYLFVGRVLVLEYFVFEGRWIGILNSLVGFTILTLVLLVLHYVSINYRTVRQIPDYWIIETTETK